MANRQAPLGAQSFPIPQRAIAVGANSFGPMSAPNRGWSFCGLVLNLSNLPVTTANGINSLGFSFTVGARYSTDGGQTWRPVMSTFDIDGYAVFDKNAGVPVDPTQIDCGAAQFLDGVLPANAAVRFDVTSERAFTLLGGTLTVG